MIYVKNEKKEKEECQNEEKGTKRRIEFNGDTISKGIHGMDSWSYLWVMERRNEVWLGKEVEEKYFLKIV